MQIDLDAGNAHPSQHHELVDGYRSPFVKREAGHVSESDPVGWIVLGEIPRSASRDVEELGRNDGIVDVFLGTGGIPLHAAFKGRKESCLVHRIEGYDIGHDHTTVPTTGSQAEWQVTETLRPIVAHQPTGCNGRVRAADPTGSSSA